MMSKRRGRDRFYIALAVAATVLTPHMLGVSERLTARLLVVGLRAAGLKAVRQPTATQVESASGRYTVGPECTPTVLSLCGIAVLWFARQPPRQYLLTCLIFMAVATCVIIGSDVLSVCLHQRGMTWAWAHFPTAIVAYTISLGGCLAFAEIRQHVLRVKAARAA